MINKLQQVQYIKDNIGYFPQLKDHFPWRSTNIMFSQKAVSFLKEEGVELSTVRIGIVPSIFPKNRTIQHFADTF